MIVAANGRTDLLYLLVARYSFFLLLHLLLLLALIAQPAFCQLVGDAVQERLNSFLRNRLRFLLSIVYHDESLQSLRLPSAGLLADTKELIQAPRTALTDYVARPTNTKNDGRAKLTPPSLKEYDAKRVNI
jgi:hypothetical protein